EFASRLGRPIVQSAINRVARHAKPPSGLADVVAGLGIGGKDLCALPILEGRTTLRLDLRSCRQRGVWKVNDGIFRLKGEARQHVAQLANVAGPGACREMLG